jgi:methionine sulfoxide reductase heme-binding subunit
MSNLKPSTNDAAHNRLETWALGGVFILAAGLLGAFGYIIFRFLPIGQSITSLLSWLFANNSVHTTWYITRAAGWIAYFLLWFSMVWGLVIPTKFFEKLLSPTFVVDFHEYVSLLSLGFIVLHVTVLLFDQYLPFTLSQILVPFMSTYRPLWVGLGVIGAYLSILVTATFYLRKKIGQKRFKSIHTLSILAYLGVILHAFFAGSDSSLVIVQWIYLSTFLVVVFLTAYWLILGRQLQKGKTERPALTNAARAIRR